MQTGSSLVFRLPGETQRSRLWIGGEGSFYVWPALERASELNKKGNTHLADQPSVGVETQNKTKK